MQEYINLICTELATGERDMYPEDVELDEDGEPVEPDDFTSASELE
jgi:hypothetical protein